MAQGKTAQAIGTFEGMIRTSPDDAVAYLSLAQIYILGKDYPKAIGVYERLLARKPKMWLAANDLAFLLAETASSGRQLDKALDWASKAYAESPKEPTVQDTLGWIYYKKGDIKKAYQWISPAAAKAPDNPSVTYHMAVVLSRMGRRDLAKQYLAKSVASNHWFLGRDEAQRMLKSL